MADLLDHITRGNVLLLDRGGSHRFGGLFLCHGLRLELLLEAVEGDDDANLAKVFVELDCVLQDVEEGLPVDVPVRAGPIRDQVLLHDLCLQILLLHHVVEGLEELEDRLRDGLGLILHIARELVHVELGVGHLARHHE